MDESWWFLNIVSNISTAWQIQDHVCWWEILIVGYCSTLFLTPSNIWPADCSILALMWIQRLMQELCSSSQMMCLQDSLNIQTMTTLPQTCREVQYMNLSKARLHSRNWRSTKAKIFREDPSNSTQNMLVMLWTGGFRTAMTVQPCRALKNSLGLTATQSQTVSLLACTLSPRLEIAYRMNSLARIYNCCMRNKNVFGELWKRQMLPETSLHKIGLVRIWIYVWLLRYKPGKAVNSLAHFFSPKATLWTQICQQILKGQARAKWDVSRSSLEPSLLLVKICSGECCLNECPLQA